MKRNLNKEILTHSIPKHIPRSCNYLVDYRDCATWFAETSTIALPTDRHA